jgi:hypothetical protein
LHGDKDLFASGDIITGNPRVYEKLSQLVRHGS